MRHGIRRFPAIWRATRLARRWYHARREAYPDWTELLSAPGQAELWRAARASAQGGPRVLLATAIGSYAHAVSLESALAAALTFRGAEVHALPVGGGSRLSRQAHLVMWGDYLSFYLAQLRGVDPTPVASIDEFKRRMAAAATTKEN